MKTSEKNIRICYTVSEEAVSLKRNCTLANRINASRDTFITATAGYVGFCSEPKGPRQKGRSQVTLFCLSDLFSAKMLKGFFVVFTLT